jgi:twinkle protein
MDILPELKSYLLQKKWKWKLRQDGVHVQTCPFCGKSKWKFVIHPERTIYHCWHCGARGNLYKLKRELGDLGKLVSAARAAGEDRQQETRPVPMKKVKRWHARLLKSQRALDYCKARGFDIGTIKHFKLGIQRKHDRLWLVIPHISDGECWNVKFRTLPPSEKQFRRVKGRGSVLFNADCLADHDWIVLCEAETDAMSFWQAGVKNVVGMTCGADSFMPEWVDLLADKERIVLVLDADKVGQQGARDIARRLGFDRCANVLLPTHDANETLTKLGPEELERSLDSAERFEVHGVVHISDALRMCQEENEIGSEGFLTPWKDVNRMLGRGWQPGDLVVLSAKFKVGKTTWALNEAIHLASLGVPSLVYCLEMRTQRLAEKVAAYVRRKSTDDLGAVDFAMARYKLRRLPLQFVDPNWGSKLKRETIFDKIREAVKRHGFRFLVFDHLHFLCRSLQYVTTEVGQVSRDFKLLAEELQIVVMLIAQPRKIQGERVIKSDDIKDSASIPMDADQVILLHRNSLPAGFSDEASADSDQEVLDSRTLVRIDAARFRGGGEAYLWYDGASATFLDMERSPAALAKKHSRPT